MQYQYLIDAAKGIGRWICDTQHPPNQSKELELATPITVDNRVKKQTPLPGITNFGSVSIFRHDISECYGYLHFIGSYRNGVYTYSRLIWYHWEYWDPME